MNFLGKSRCMLARHYMQKVIIYAQQLESIKPGDIILRARNDVGEDEFIRRESKREKDNAEKGTCIRSPFW